MSRWEDLYRVVKSAEAEREEAQRQEIEAVEARAERDAWGVSALNEAWAEIHAKVLERAEEFRRATGKRVECGPEIRVVADAPNAPGVRVLDLRFDASAAYLYSHHESGAFPNLYVAQWRESARERRHHHRMLTLPLCRLERGASGWVLRRSTHRDPELSVDDVVFRVFELLVLGAPQSRGGSGGARRVAPS